MNTNFTYQTFQSRNKSDIQNIDQLIEEEGIHYNMQALLKYPQSRARIQNIQKTENIRLSELAVQSLTTKNKLKPNIKSNTDVESLLLQIKKLERKISKFEPDLKYIHDMNNFNALDITRD